MTERDKTLEEESKKRRAQDAALVLDNPAFIEAFDSVATGLHAMWEQSPEADSEGRERAYRQLAGLRAVKNHLKSYIEDGKIIEHKQAYAASLNKAE